MKFSFVSLFPPPCALYNRLKDVTFSIQKKPQQVYDQEVAHTHFC